jgi:hypothetical protein
MQKISSKLHEKTADTSTNSQIRSRELVSNTQIISVITGLIVSMTFHVFEIESKQ